MNLHDRQSAVNLNKSALSPDKGRPLYKAGDWDEDKHPRGPDGKFGVGSGADTGASPASGSTGSKLIDTLKDKGGFTINPETGEHQANGYAVSPYPERSFAKDLNAVTPADIARYVAKNLDLLSQADHFIGGWHDTSTGKVVLDVSIVKHTAKEADEVSRKFDQKAFYSLHEGKEYTVNPNATSGGVL